MVKGRQRNQNESYFGLGVLRSWQGVFLLLFSERKLHDLLEHDLLTMRLFQLLNVQVPFYFKSIVDSLNIPVSELSGSQTLWTVAGTAVVGCEFELVCFLLFTLLCMV